MLVNVDRAVNKTYNPQGTSDRSVMNCRLKFMQVPIKGDVISFLYCPPMGGAVQGQPTTSNLIESPVLLNKYTLHISLGVIFLFYLLKLILLKGCTLICSCWAFGWDASPFLFHPPPLPQQLLSTHKFVTLGGERYCKPG